MADNQNQNDLRNQKPGGVGSTEAQMPGRTDQQFPTTDSGEHAVNPGIGSKAGVAAGQVTKSN